MIEAVVSGLLVAAVSGLAFLSYKHHEGYQIVAKPLKYMAWAILIAANSFSMGFTSGKYSKTGEEPFSLGWVTIGFVVFWIFIGLLDFLPLLTKTYETKGDR